ncbi:hypothetical protein DFH09DRAFT_844323, partial [Mycena vulgaris]
DWKFNCMIRKEDVMDDFFLYSLLLDKSEQSGILVLPHDESGQGDRLKPALAERNSAMEGTGQECYAHTCDLCFIIVENEQGQLMKLQAAACDGNTIGHRSCKCAVIECSTGNAPGFRTCANPEHHALETAYFKRRDAIFQLR